MQTALGIDEIIRKADVKRTKAVSELWNHEQFIHRMQSDKKPEYNMQVKWHSNIYDDSCYTWVEFLIKGQEHNKVVVCEEFIHFFAALIREKRVEKIDVQTTLNGYQLRTYTMRSHMRLIIELIFSDMPTCRQVEVGRDVSIQYKYVCE